jgi:hypothetical protein
MIRLPRLNPTFLALSLLLFATLLPAAEDRTAAAKLAAQQAAETWLSGVDRGAYGESWDAAASLFQKGGARETWVSTLEQGRRPLGAVHSRALKSAEYATSLPGAPTGEYVALQFRTVFEKPGPMIEKLVTTFENGRWKMLGYRVIPEGDEARGEAAKKAAQPAAESWLAGIDRGAYAESWDAASSVLQKALPRDAWVRTMEQVRRPLGKVKSRTLRGAQYSTSLPGAPAGEYVVLQFDSTFETRGPSVETVTMMAEGGAWRSAGYFIK